MTRALEKITFDDQKLLNVVGDWDSGDDYGLIPKILDENNTHLKLDILISNGLLPKGTNQSNFYTRKTGLAEFHKFACQFLGNQFNKRFTAATFEHWVGDYKKLIFKTCSTYKMYGSKPTITLHDNKVKNFHKHKTKVLRAYDDGLLNILPFVIEYGLEPKELKHYFGKSNWRRLSNSSLTFNRSLVECIDSYFAGISDFRLPEIREYVDVATRIKKSIITRYEPIKGIDFNQSENCRAKSNSFLDIKLLEFINSNTLVTKQCEVNRAINLFNDCRTMAKNNDVRFNPSWSIKRMEREHNRLVEILRIQSYQNNHSYDLDWANSLPNELSTSNNKFKVKFLKCELDFRVESDLMRHCIYGYFPSFAAKIYLAFNIENEGVMSTLGLNRDNGKWKLDQHYHKYNEPVVREDFLEIQKEIISVINQEYKYLI